MNDREEALYVALELRDWLKDADRSVPEVASLLRGCDAIERGHPDVRPLRVRDGGDVMPPSKLVVTIEMCPWLQAVVFAAVELMQEVEDSDPALVTDGIQEKAAAFREALGR